MLWQHGFARRRSFPGADKLPASAAIQGGSGAEMSSDIFNTAGSYQPGRTIATDH